MLVRFKSSYLAGVSIFITTMTVGMTFNPLTIQESMITKPKATLTTYRTTRTQQKQLYPRGSVLQAFSTT